MTERNQILNNHFYGYWKGSTDGYYYINVIDPSTPSGLRRFKSKSIEKLKDKVVGFYLEKNADDTISDIFDKWLKEKLDTFKEISYNTAIRYRTLYKKHFEGKPFEKIKISKLTFLDIEEFVRATVGIRKMTSKEYRNIRTLLSGIIRFAKRRGLTNLSSKDIIDIKLNKNAFISNESKYFTTKEVRKIEEYIDSQPEDIYHLAILIAKNTQVRSGELAALKLSDFDFKNHILTVSRSERKVKNDDYEKGIGGKTKIVVTNYTKGHKDSRKVIISDCVKQIVDRILEINPDGEYLFEKNGKRLTAEYLSKRLSRIAGLLQIGEMEKHKDGHIYSKGKGIHSLRKYGTSRLLKGTKELAPLPPKMVQERLGHSDINVTNTYYNFEIDGEEENYKMCEELLKSL